MSALVDVSSVGKKNISKLFDSFGGAGGNLDYNVLNKTLRSGNTVVLNKDLQAGAKGTIETESKNKSSIRSGKASGPKIGKLAPRPPSQSARGAGAPRRAPPANNGASSARGAAATAAAVADGGGRPQSRGRGDVPHALVDPRSGLDGRPDTAPSASGRATSPLEGWGFGGGGNDGLASVSQVSSTSRVSRPASRAGGGSVSGSSYRGKRGGGSASRSDLGDRSDYGSQKGGFGMPNIDPKENMRRAADVYLQGAPAPGMRRAGLGAGRHASPRTRGLPSLTEDGSRRGAGWVAGGGIGSREELEAALAQAQTALVMAKERISMLEQQNALLRGGNRGGGKGGGGGGVGITKEKYMEANQLLSEGMLTDQDFATIKAKYMLDSYGI